MDKNSDAESAFIVPWDLLDSKHEGNKGPKEEQPIIQLQLMP